ncbi:MAG: folate-binding protein YgfZ [Planctomycetales bacterium]|nr:folate-binding protein YgfZ [Planctomycetales bacterium]
MTEPQGQRSAFANGCGITPIRRTRIEVSGSDRASFLHNFCTNDIKKLTPGEGCEAFFTNVQGKTICHGFLFAQDDSIVIDTVADQGEFLVTHLDRYLITEDVKLADRSSEFATLAVGGPTLPAVLERLGLSVPEKYCQHRAGIVADATVSIFRVNVTSDISCFLTLAAQRVEAVVNVFLEFGAEHCDETAFTLARVRNGFPEFGADVTNANLPQEVDRDTLAISFTKGCYLGQETVARLDALGHVNRILRRVSIDCSSGPPQPQDKILFDGKEIGWFGSVVCSGEHHEAFAYLRTEHAAAGTEFESDGNRIFVQ